MVQHRQKTMLLGFILAWVIALMLAPTLDAAARQPAGLWSMPTVEPEAVNPPLENIAGITLDARPAFGSIYRPGSWVPVYVTVQNDSSDIAAEVRITARSSATFGTTLDLPNGARKTVTVYVFVPDSARRMTVHLVRQGSPVIDQTSTLAQQQVTLDPQNSRVHMVALLTGEGTSVRLPDRLAHDARVVNVSLDPAALPDRALGLAMFDTLVLNNVPTHALNEAAQTTLREWVLRGGHLVVAGGPGAEQTLAGLPPELQPVQVLGQEPVAATALLGDATADLGTLSLARVEPVAEARILPVTGINPVGELPLLVERPAGSGSVTFFAAALNVPALDNVADEQRFWSNLLRQRQNLPVGFGPANPNLDMFTESNVATSLTRLPALELPALATLGLLLLTYIVLVGPVTYLLLRKLDHQALGWIVVPALTIMFALVAYGMGYAKRGGDVVLNQISLVEPLRAGSAEDMARVRSFVGVFSPERRSYTLETPRAALLRPISLQGPWDTGQGSQSGVFLQDQSLPAVSGAQATNLEVPQWSMRAVMADELRPYQSVTAQVTLDGTKLTGVVRNVGDLPLRDVVLIQGEQVAHLGDLAPGEEQQAALTLDTASSHNNFQGHTPLSYLIYGDEMDRMQKSHSQPLPPDKQLRAGLLDALYSYGPTTRNAQPMLLAWADQSLLTVEVVDQRVARQQLSLITFNPRLHVTSQELTLGQGWMERRIEADPESQCMGSQGIGFTLFGQPVIETLRLPPELAGLQPEQITLIPLADGPWPADITVELFDWNAGEWMTQSVDAQPLTLEQPAGFLSNRGEMRLRINGEVGMQNAPGCMIIDAALAGTMPDTEG